MARWTQDSRDIGHHIRILNELAKANAGKSGYLLVHTVDGRSIQGWVIKEQVRSNATQKSGISTVPTSWRGVVSLLTDTGSKIEIEFLEITKIEAVKPP
jgi:hypothetical protein